MDSMEWFLGSVAVLTAVLLVGLDTVRSLQRYRVRLGRLLGKRKSPSMISAVSNALQTVRSAICASILRIKEDFSLTCRR